MPRRVVGIPGRLELHIEWTNVARSLDPERSLAGALRYLAFRRGTNGGMRLAALPQQLGLAAISWLRAYTIGSCQRPSAHCA